MVECCQVAMHSLHSSACNSIADVISCSTKVYKIVVSCLLVYSFMLSKVLLILLLHLLLNAVMSKMFSTFMVP